MLADELTIRIQYWDTRGELRRMNITYERIDDCSKAANNVILLVSKYAGGTIYSIGCKPVSIP